MNAQESFKAMMARETVVFTDEAKKDEEFSQEQINIEYIIDRVSPDYVDLYSEGYGSVYDVEHSKIKTLKP